MSKESLRDETARLDRMVDQILRYGMLVFILCQFVVAIGVYLHTASGRDPYSGFITSFTWLFMYLAWAFKWPRPVKIALYILLVGWMIFCLYDLFYELPRVFHPIHMPGGN